MRMLFTMDAKNYAPDAPLHIRPSVRGIVIRDGKVLMVHSRKYDYYKFPGGGIEAGECRIEALCREVREETGFAVLPNSIREYGMVHRRERDHDGTTFVQDNFYYLCEIGEKLGQELDDYEDEEGFTPEFVDPKWAIHVNRFHDHQDKWGPVQYRDSRVLVLLMEEGHFN